MKTEHKQSIEHLTGRYVIKDPASALADSFLRSLNIRRSRWAPLTYKKAASAFDHFD